VDGQIDGFSDTKFLTNAWCLKIADFKMELWKKICMLRGKSRWGSSFVYFQIDPAQLSYYSVFSMVHMCDGTRATASLHPK
jgi:hypothetical protein